MSPTLRPDETGLRKCQSQLCGSSYEWWPPRGDHVILFKANPLRFEHFDHTIETWKGQRVLDVGCGGGYTSEFLAQRGAVVCGTDLLPEALSQADEHAREAGLSIDYRPCTRERLPCGDAAMDVVTCFDVLEHVEDKRLLLTEISRVLKPGGWLLFDTANKTLWSRLLMIWLGEVLTRLIRRWTHDWQLFVSPQELGCLLVASGFGAPELAGPKLDLRPLVRGGLPFRIVSGGNQAVMYFGAARKQPASVL